MFTGPRSSKLASFLALTVLSACASLARAQSVPVPFAGTFAGGGTICSTSIPLFAVTGAGRNYGDGCPATQATLNTPVSAATDRFGNIYISDQTNNLTRVVYNGGAALAAAIVAANVQTTGLVPQKGYIYTLVGGTSPASASTYYCNQAGMGTTAFNSRLDGCPGAQAYIQPRGLAVDNDGNLFISSVGGGSNVHVLYAGGTAAANLIKLENPTVTTPQIGYVYSVAGAANTAAFAGDGGLAYKATLYNPRGLFIDASENVYISDTQNGLIRKVDGTTGIITTVVGDTTSAHCAANKACTASNSAGDGTPATSAGVFLYFPYGIAFDGNGNLFIADSGVNTVAAGTAGTGRVRVVYAGGTLPGITNPVVGNIYTYAGGAAATGTAAQQTTFQFVYGLNIDAQGFLYIDDYRALTTGSNHIWRVDPTNGSIAIIAGNGATAASTAGASCSGTGTGPVASNVRGDGCPATQAYLNLPQQAPVFDAYGNFYIADRGNNVIRSFTYNNLFPATPVGSSVTQPLAFVYPSVPVAETFTTEGSATTDFSDAGGATCALNASLPLATTCVDYVKFSPTTPAPRFGSLTVTSGTGTIARQVLAGVGSAPILTIDPGTSVPLGSAIQPLGVSADQSGNVYLSDGKGKQLLRTTIAGGVPTAVLTGLGSPRQSTTDSFGNVFVADATANAIIEHTVGGTTVTLGTGLSAPQGVVADQLGNLFVADTGNNRLLYYSPVNSNQLVVSPWPLILSAPTMLAIDATGNLYVVDSGNNRIVEIPINGAAQAVTLPAGTSPVALAFDLSGDLYVADKTTAQILVIAPGNSTATSLVTNLTTPAGLAVGSTGNLFVADSSLTSVTAYNRGLNTTTFTTTNIGLTSLPVALDLSNLGNIALSLATPAFTSTNAAFPSSGTPTCTNGAVLNPAGACTQSFVFQPITTGPQTSQVVYSSTTGQSVTAKFSGTATNLILTTTSIALTSPASGTVNYGVNATYTVTLTPQSTGSSAPTGTITLVVDGATQGTKTVTANPYTFPLTLAVGIHTVAAVYSGDAIYAGSNTSTSLTVSKATTSTTTSSAQSASGITLSATVTALSTGLAAPTGSVTFYVDNVARNTVPVGNGSVSTTVLIADGTHSFYAVYTGDANYATSTSATQNVTVQRTPTTIALTSTPTSSGGVSGLLLAAKVSAAGAGTPTGTIVFSNGATTLGTVTISATGTATLTTASTTFASYSFTAAYSGDGLYQPATVTITQGPDFVVVSPTTTLTVPQSSSATASIAVAPINGYSGTLTASCSNLPSNALCRFQPRPLVLTASASGTLSVQVFVGIDSSLASIVPFRWSKLTGPMLALLLITPAAFGRGRRRRRSLPWLLAALIAMALPFALSGCGANKTPAATASYPTPVGTTAVTVTLTDANGLSRSGILNVAVLTP